MKRSHALAILIGIIISCVIVLGVSIAMVPGEDKLGAYMDAAGDVYSFLMPISYSDNDAPAATAEPEAARPTATAEPAATDAAPTSTPETVDLQSQAVGDVQPVVQSEAPTAAPDPTAAPTSNLPVAQSVSALADADSFGTPERLDEATPKYSYSALSAQTGLDEEVLDKLYTPFYVLNIGMDEVYYPMKSPGGSKGNDKIYGGQVGVEVVSIEGDYAYIKAHRYPGGRATEGYVPTKLLKEVTPDDRYSIVIDKRQQRLFLFEYGELKADMYCSSGKTTTETPAGEFIKYGTKRTIYSDADPDIAYYGIRLNGRVYIHSVSHIDGDYSKSIAMLGRKASHGCVRVPLDWAKWFYENIPDGTKVIITEYRGDTPPLGEGGRDGD